MQLHGFFVCCRSQAVGKLVKKNQFNFPQYQKILCDVENFIFLKFRRSGIFVSRSFQIIFRKIESFMKVKPLGILLAAGGIYLAYNLFKVGRLARMIFFPGSIHSFDFIGSTPVIEFNVQIQNTSSKYVRVNSLAGNLFSDGVLVGNVHTTSLINVPPNQSISTRLTAQLGLLGIVNTLIASWQNRDMSKEIVFDGYANVDDFQLPLELKFNLGV